MPHCTRCGTMVSETAAFCPNCGQAQGVAAPAGAKSGLSENGAAVLSYVLGWISGLIFFLIDKRPYVRFHAAQAVVVFGLAALLIVTFGALAVASLAFRPAAFGFFVSAATLTWAAGVVLWGVAMWKAAGGDEWKVPVASGWVARLSSGDACVAPTTTTASEPGSA